MTALVHRGNYPLLAAYPINPSSNLLKIYYKKSKGKVHPITGHEGLEVAYRCSSILSLTSTLDGVDGQRHALAALPPGKTR